MPFSKKQLLISKPFENPNFIQSNHFTGAKPGFFFGSGVSGQGYYKDNNDNKNNKINNNSPPSGYMPTFINKIEETQYKKFPLYTKEGYKVLKLKPDLRKRLNKYMVR